jgi:hypothetical protein
MSTGDSGNGPDDVPKEVIEQAKAAFTRRRQGEVAVLVWDSMVDDRAPAADHQLRFEHADVRIELRILRTEKWSRVEGRVQPPGAPEVQLESDHGDVLHRVDVTDGTFILEQVASAVVRLCLRNAPPATTICTDWFRV